MGEGMTGHFLRRPRGIVLASLMMTLVTAATTTTVALARQSEPTRPVAPAMNKDVQDVAYDRVIEVYRSGATDRAVDDLYGLLTPKYGVRPSETRRRIDTWIQNAERSSRQADLEALLLLCTEAIVKAWPAGALFPQKPAPYWAAAGSPSRHAAAHEPQVTIP